MEVTSDSYSGVDGSQGAYVLVQQRDYSTGELYLRAVPQNALTNAAVNHAQSNVNPSLNSSLWKIKVTEKEIGTYIYTFVNKETGFELSYNCADAINITAKTQIGADGHLVTAATGEWDINQSDVNEWRWYTAEKAEAGFGAMKLYAYNHTNEKIIGLAFQNGTDRIGTVIADRALATGTSGSQTIAGDYHLLSLTVRNAGARVLTAEDINSMIDADGSWMNPNQVGSKALFKASNDFKNNDLFSGEYIAQNTEITGYKNSEYASSAYAGYSVVLNKKGTNKYFMVATDARYEDDEVPTAHGGLKVYDEIAPENLTSGKMDAYKARFHWKVTYYPTQDSLVMEPLNASMLGSADYQAGKSWKETPLAAANNSQFYNTVNAGKAHANGSAATTTNVPFNKKQYVPVALTLMNGNVGIDEKTVLTVGQPVNTAISSADYAKGGSSAKFGLPMVTDNVADMGIKINFAHNYTYMERTTAANGLYFIKVAVKGDNKTNYRKDGDNLVMNMWGQLMYDRQDDYQNYEHMPAAQWVIEQDTCEFGSATPYVKITNREYAKQAFHGQLYKTEDGRVYFINHSKDYINGSDTKGKFNKFEFACGDTLYLEQITKPEITQNAYLGYKKFNAEDLNYETWAIKYSTAETYGGLNDAKYLQIAEDGIMAVQTEMRPDFEVSAGEEAEYGYTIPGLAQLKRQGYTLKVRDNNLIDNQWNYVVVKDDENGNPYFQSTHLKNVDGKDVLLGAFYFKADQLTAEGDTAYVPVQILGYKDMNRPVAGWTGWEDVEAAAKVVATSKNTTDYAKYANRKYYENGFAQLGIKSQTTNATYVSLDTDPETTNDAFVFVKEDRPLYMTIGKDVKTIDMFRDRGTAKEYFFENGDKDNFSFLGLTAEGIKPEGENTTTEFYVDPVVSSNPRMPQYLFFVANDSIEDGRWCDTWEHGYFATVEEADAKDKTHHVFYNGYNAGRVLVNLNDSIFQSTDAIDFAENCAKYGFQNFTRLGFVEAIHMNVTAEELNVDEKVGAFDFLGEGEWLLVLKATTLKALTDEFGVIDPKLVEEGLANGTIDKKPLNGKHQNYAFSLRYTNDEAESMTDNEVLLESQGRKDVTTNYEGKIGTFNEASWLKVHNGVPVLAQPYNYNGDHTGIGSATSLEEVVNQSQIIRLSEGETGSATANEEISTSSVVVAGVNGAVVVKGAEGKNVIVSTILGKVVANEVVSSDNATIAAPAGIVVVSVDGESFKVVVK